MELSLNTLTTLNTNLILEEAIIDQSGKRKTDIDKYCLGTTI